jgi:uncharacterized protein YndB with AHSA1/START domain
MSTATATRSVVVEREFAHPPEKVWRALTQGPLLEEWLMKNDFKPVVGHRFNFRAEPNPHWNGVTDCEVLAVQPHERLQYSWSSSGDEAKDGLRTLVTWTLSPTKAGTLLRMEQSGFREGAADDGFFQGASWGWQKMVGKLGEVLAGLA